MTVRRELTRMATAATFLTRAPWVARFASGDPAELGASVRWFPLIGVGTGAVIAGVYALAALAMSPLLAAVLAVAAGLLATGAFHEDGWADAFDGLFGGHTPARRMEIMRDSRLGTYGAAALLLLLIAKVAAVSTLSPQVALVALVALHAWSRASAPWLARALPYVHGDGPMKPVADGVGRREVTIATLVALLATLPLAWIAPWTAAALIALTVPLWWGAAALFRARIGGVTGDCLGAVNQATELLWLVMLAAIVGVR